MLPHRLRAKEGIALLAGSPVAAALALARLRAGERLAGQLQASAAAAVDALQAPLDPYDEAVGRLAGDPVLEEVLAGLGRATRGRAAGPGPGGGPGLQAPVSFRVAPQVLAHLRRTLGRLDEDVRRALAAVTDSPAVVGGRVVAGGGFHAAGLAAGMDGVAVALVQAAELAGQRLHRLLDGRFSGLPDQLSPAAWPARPRSARPTPPSARRTRPASPPRPPSSSAGSRSWPARSSPASSWPPARPGGSAAVPPARRPGWSRWPPASGTWSPPSTGTAPSAPTWTA